MIKIIFNKANLKLTIFNLICYFLYSSLFAFAFSLIIVATLELFNENRNLPKFFIFQVLGSVLTGFSYSLVKLQAISINKQLNIILLNTRNEIIHKIISQKYKIFMKDSVYNYSHQITENVNLYINTWLEKFYILFEVIISLFYVLAIIIIFGMLYSYFIFIIGALIFMIIFLFIVVPIITIKYISKIKENLLKSKEKFLYNNSNFIISYNVFFWSNKVHKLEKIHLNNSDILQKAETKAIFKNSWIIFIENFMENILDQAPFIINAFLVILNPINAIILFWIDKLFALSKENSLSGISALKDLKSSKNYSEQYQNYSLLKIIAKTAFPEEIQKIQLNNLTVTIKEKCIFKNKNFTFLKNKKYIVTGPSGVGKSTLINVIMQEQDFSQGSLKINGRNYEEIKNFDLREQIFFIGNNDYLLEGTVRENIALFDEKIDEMRMMKALEVTNIDFENKNFKVESLSTGQAQKIAIARAIYQNKKILIFDESFSNLDDKSRNKFENYFLNQKDITWINVTHHTNNKNLYDEIITLNRK